MEEDAVVFTVKPRLISFAFININTVTALLSQEHNLFLLQLGLGIHLSQHQPLDLHDGVTDSIRMVSEIQCQTLVCLYPLWISCAFFIRSQMVFHNNFSSNLWQFLLPGK